MLMNYILNNLLMLLAFLSVVGIGAMFTVVMLLDEERVHCCLGIECERNVSHLGTLLHHLGIVHGIRGACSP